MIASNAKNRAQNPSAAYRPALFGQTLILPPSRMLVQTGTDDTARAFPVFTGYPSSGLCSSTISALRFSGGSRRKYSGLNLNRYGVASPCRTGLNLIHYILRPLQNSLPSRQLKP
ncbi:TPA: hypothetical protein ACFK6Y_11650 [Neisseria gonorrhoeae]|uniref:Uncharacterized protein n=3 Tax=Neisseria gonorrhoeae TaxID=485 RepID=A0AA44U7X1_NEIGO|nr:hypothetical protein A9Y60_03525 [Neisseria gonorrhoeae]EEZ56785.1 predicted protein [Neisseria gonorrhoeae SK-92-679]KLR90969.1 hypothetical protein M678_05160 [Neisseria gonorrhoeae SK7461]KLS22797.1 hypothetical protein M731_10310 [Neisseria gonorrhoeae ATL_2011_01-25]KLS25550.1 hypothetical protein M737_06295 [Neisseria gonorrhoeae MIA_2011_05-10]KLS37594.1 hypothetical protein M689_03295 [Neisseria gonorrhoeae SK23020]KLS61969.1 hypothetical protein M739_05355 [Neisseria gonorrhoeae M